MIAAAVTTVTAVATVAATPAIATMATAPTVTATATTIAATATAASTTTTTTTTILGIGARFMGNGIWYQSDGSRKDTANCQRQQSSLEKQVIVHRAFSW
jgi:hypothetical protein